MHGLLAAVSQARHSRLVHLTVYVRELRPLPLASACASLCLWHASPPLLLKHASERKGCMTAEGWHGWQAIQRRSRRRSGAAGPMRRI